MLNNQDEIRDYPAPEPVDHAAIMRPMSNTERHTYAAERADDREVQRALDDLLISENIDMARDALASGLDALASAAADVREACDELRRLYDVEYVEGGRATPAFEHRLQTVANDIYLLSCLNPLRDLERD